MLVTIATSLFFREPSTSRYFAAQIVRGASDARSSRERLKRAWASVIDPTGAVQLNASTEAAHLQERWPGLDASQPPLSVGTPRSRMSLAALASLSLADGNANDGSPLLVAVESRALKRAAESQAPAALQTSQVAAPPPAGAPPTDLIGALARIREDIARFRDTPPDQRDADAVRPALEDPLNVLLASPADLAASLPTNVSSSHYFAFLEDSKDLARDVASLRSSFLTRHAALHLGYLLAEASPTIPEGTPLSELLDAHFISLKANPYAALVACSSVLARGAQANHGEAVKRAASLLSRLFAGRSLLDFYTYLESLSRIEGGSVRQSAGMPNDSGRHTRHQRSLWEEFTDLACAAPDRVASSLTEADESMWHDNFFAKLGVDLEHAVFAVSLRESKGLAEAARAFGTLIAKLGRLNRLDALFGTCLPVIWKRITGPVGEDYVKAWSAVLSNAGDLEKPAEALVRAIDSKVLTANSDAKVIRELAERLVVPLLGNSTGFAHLFGDKFLLRRTFSANSLRLFYASLDVANLRPNGDREWHLKAMLALLRTWTSKAWIGGVGDARHLCKYFEHGVCLGKVGSSLPFPL